MVLSKEQLQKIAVNLALVVHTSIAWEESLDGDDTEYLSKEFLKELDELNGNV